MNSKVREDSDISATEMLGSPSKGQESSGLKWAVRFNLYLILNRRLIVKGVLLKVNPFHSLSPNSGTQKLTAGSAKKSTHCGDKVETGE